MRKSNIGYRQHNLLINILLLSILAEFSKEECQLYETTFTCNGDDPRTIIYEFNSKNSDNIKVTDIKITTSSSIVLKRLLVSLEDETKMGVKKLKIRNCDVREEDISDILSNLYSLEVLDLGNNKIENLNFFETLSDNITEIYLDNNEVKEVSDSFSGLQNLQVIDLSYCHIETLDFTVFKNNLNLLLVNVSHNNIRSSVSEEFLKNIKCVDISYNNLEKYGNIPSYCLDLSHTEMTGYRWYNISEKNRTVFIENFFYSGNNRLQISAINIKNESIPIEIKFLNISSYTGSISDLDLKNVRVRNELILKDSTIPSLDKSVYDFKVLFFDGGTNATFDLSNCSITEISPLYFEKYSLGRLNLCHNKFKILENDVFKDAYLIQLDLCNSSVEEIGDHTFRGVHSILLNLSSNSIDKINFLKEIDDVKILDLSRNKITALNSEAFSNLKHLRVLYLNDNLITTIETGSFSLERIEVINLCNNQLIEIRTLTFEGTPHLREIILQGNPLVTVETNAFKSLENLRILDFGHMNIVYIQPRAFNNLQNLGVIYLNNNNLSQLDPSAFTDVPRLKEIRLEGNCLNRFESLNRLNIDTLAVKICNDNSNFENLHNPNLRYLYLIESNLNNFQGFGSYNLVEVHFIDSPFVSPSPTALSGLFNVRYINEKKLFMNVEVLPKYVFRDMRSLNDLDLSGLVIRVIEPKAFVGLVSLSDLSLANNRISQLSSYSFQGLNGLRNLDLCNNHISVIAANVFDGADKIEILRLTNNILHIIPLGTFNNISSLQILNLGSNRIDQLSTGTFSNLPNLKNLDISYNRISSLCSGFFFPLINLEKLNLDGNRLNQISASDLVSYSPNLSSIHLDKNNWDCDSLIKMLYDLRRGNVSVEISEQGSFRTTNVDGIFCRSSCI